MDLLRWLLFGVLPAVAAVLLGVGVGGPRWLALSLATAICVPFGIVLDWPDWFWRLDPVRGDPRPALWWTLLFAGLVGSLYDLRYLPKIVAVGLEFLLVAALPWLLAGRLHGRASFEHLVLWLGAGWIVIAVVWWVVRRAAKAQPGVTVPLAMAGVFGADAWLLHQHAGGSDWQLAGVAATGLGFAVVTTAWRRPFECGTGAGLCMTLAHTGLLLCGRGERELLELPFVLAWLAPVPLWLASAGPAARWRRTGACLAVVAVGGMCALAVAAA